MHQMENEIIILRRGEDSNIRNTPSPQGVGAPNFGFRNITKGNQCIENLLFQIEFLIQTLLMLWLWMSLLKNSLKWNKILINKKLFSKNIWMLLYLRIPHLCSLLMKRLNMDNSYLNMICINRIWFKLVLNFPKHL